MASKRRMRRRFQQSSCGVGKHPYANKALAQKAVEHWWRQGERMVPYECRFCHHWHVGHHSKLAQHFVAESARQRADREHKANSARRIQEAYARIAASDEARARKKMLKLQALSVGAEETEATRAERQERFASDLALRSQMMAALSNGAGETCPDGHFRDFAGPVLV